MKIESKSLMLMDWVRSRTGMNVTIVGIDHDFPSEYEAISLTREILEKNGWIYVEGSDYSTFPVPSKYTHRLVPFVLVKDGEAYIIANTFTIRYVHELQHILRLCGFEELANTMQL